MRQGWDIEAWAVAVDARRRAGYHLGRSAPCCEQACRKNGVSVMKKLSFLLATAAALAAGGVSSQSFSVITGLSAVGDSGFRPDAGAGNTLLAQKPSLPATSQTNELAQSKAALESYLQITINQGKAEAEKLRGAIRSGRRLEYAMSLDEVLKYTLKQNTAQEKLRAHIAATAAGALPAELSRLRLSCKSGACEGGMDTAALEEALLAYGPLVLAPLRAAWAQQDDFTQESLIYLSGRFTTSSCQQSWLQEALAVASFRTRFAALKVFKKTCDTSRFWPLLDAQLEREKDPDLILALLDLFKNTEGQSPVYLSRLLEMVEAGRISLTDSFPQICSQASLERKQGQRPLNSAFWLKAYQQNPARRLCLVETIFLEIKDPRSLSGLAPLASDAASHLYGFTATQDLSRRNTAPNLKYWGGRPGTDVAVLTMFQQKLPASTIQSWFDQPGATLGDRMVLGQWLGKSPVTLLPEPLTLTVTVEAPDGKIVSQHSEVVALNEPFSFTAAAVSAGFPVISYSGNLRFQDERLSYLLDGFLVGFKPFGAGFNAIVPVMGEFQTSLVSDGKPYLWRLRVR